MLQVLHYAEEIIQHYASPSDCADYFNNKRRQILGPFADVTLILQKENRDISLQISALKEKREQKLSQLISKEILELAKQYGTVISEEQNIQQAMKTLVETINMQENEMRIDIERQRNNQMVYRQMIQEESDKTISTSTQIVGKRKSLSEKSKKISQKIKILEEHYSQSISSISKIKKELEPCKKKVQILSKQLQKIKPSLDRLTTKREDLYVQHQDLVDQFEKISAQVKDIKIQQRFGFKPSSKNRQEVEKLFELKELIEQREREKRQIQSRKQKSLMKKICYSNENSPQPIVTY